MLAKRKNQMQFLTYYSVKSIVWQYYIKGVKRFQDIKM